MSERPSLPESAVGPVLGLVLGSLVLVLFVTNVREHWFLGDDAYICFRYAENLIQGHGLVYNPGERVEGYTTFAWVLLMAGVMRLGLAPETWANVLGVASGVAVLALLVVAARRRGWRGIWPWVAPVALASNRTFAAWCTGGLATQFFALLVTGGAILFAFERRRYLGAWKEHGAAASRVAAPSAVLFALAQLTRPEAVLYASVAGAFLALDALRGRLAFRAVGRWAVTFAALPVMHLAFRIQYYGQPLPNTFYAKVSGLWLDQGARYLDLFVRHHVLWLWLPFVLLLYYRRRTPWNAFTGTLVLAHLAWVLYVGGDRFEFRFLTPVLPLAWFLVAEALRSVAVWLPEPMGPRFGAAAAIAFSMTSALPTRQGFDKQHGINSLENIEAVAEMRAEQGRFLRELVEDGILPADTRLGVRGAGALPYYAGLPTLDLHGLNDLEIARQEVTTRGVVAHEKVATPEILRARRVAICEVKNELVFDEPPAILERPVEQAFYRGKLRCLEARGRYLVFVTTLDEAEFRERFARFRIVQ